MATHIHTPCALWPGPNCVLTEMQEFCRGNVFGRLRAQTEAGNIHPEPKKVLRVHFWQGLCIVLLCVFVKDSCGEMKYLVWSFLWGVLKPFEFYFYEVRKLLWRTTELTFQSICEGDNIMPSSIWICTVILFGFPSFTFNVKHNLLVIFRNDICGR